MEMLVIAVIALVAFAAVLIPLFRRRPGVGDELEFENIPADPAAEAAGSAPDAERAVAAVAQAEAASGDLDDVEREVLRYREALRAGTVCRRCGAANAPGSTYCMECGRRLAGPDSKEFE